MDNTNPTQNFSSIKDRTPEYFTIEVFNSMVIDGTLTNRDGIGFYAREDQYPNITVNKISSVMVKLSEIISDHEKPDVPFVGIRERMNNGTHVAWFPNEIK